MENNKLDIFIKIEIDDPVSDVPVQEIGQSRSERDQGNAQYLRYQRKSLKWSALLKRAWRSFCLRVNRGDLQADDALLDYRISSPVTILCLLGKIFVNSRG
ncbi:hypothetical protein TNCV_2387081 [Trichonephila clavipes]|nr:hypothetical protein TNCV_2387081 [Trichonephila clavipes]